MWCRINKKRGGYSLIEILVVLAVVSMLMAISVPSLSRAKESARMVLCGSNLHQIDLAMRLYVEDHKGSLPEFFYSWEPGKSKSGVILLHFKPKWAVAAGWNYFPEEVMVCPSDNDPALVSVINRKTGIIEQKQCSYDVNVDFLLRDKKYWNVRYPAQLAIMFDGTNGGIAKQGSYPGTEAYLDRVEKQTGEHVGAFVRRHMEVMGTVLWGDGHVTFERELGIQDLIELGSTPLTGPGNSGK